MEAGIECERCLPDASEQWRTGSYCWLRFACFHSTVDCGLLGFALTLAALAATFLDTALMKAAYSPIIHDAAYSTSAMVVWPRPSMSRSSNSRPIMFSTAYLERERGWVRCVVCGVVVCGDDGSGGGGGGNGEIGQRFGRD